MANVNRICCIVLIAGFAFVKGENVVTSECLVCICEAATGCNFTKDCNLNSNACGPFRITKPYWAGAGSPTLLDESPQSVSAFTHCTNLYCSIKTVQMFMTKHERDCNGDGIINCDDFAAIHQLGWKDCEKKLPDDFVSPYQKCRSMLLKKMNWVVLNIVRG
ncbi:lysozyme 1-like [Zophobas morio]|uniref:lysozyme 1-like n=1 Tax=Zophobas morio TaxID=2755281 RepID=UPI003083339B